jgi:hypothetical protein
VCRDDPSDEDTPPRSRKGQRYDRRGGYNGRTEEDLMLLDPKRVKRILANRQSAARSKERRLAYTLQLESKMNGLENQKDDLLGQMDKARKETVAMRQMEAQMDKEVRRGWVGKWVEGV